jgi:hypothetical protein
MTTKMSPSRITYVLLTLLLLCMTSLAFGEEDRGEGPLNPAQPTGITPEQIIEKFAAKEAQFKQARESYTWRQDVKVQTLDGNTVDGEYRQVVDILFDDRGKRVENVVFAPQSSLQRISMTREDFDDIEKRLPFVLTSEEIPDYNILYVGQQKEDELNTFVFDVAPKKIEKNRRYFQGRIWVDDHDFQIVKTRGKNVPDIVSKNGENLFPPFTTWREQIDGKYWFPTYTLTDDSLHFKTGDVRIRQIVKYTNYKRFGSQVKITYEGQDIGAGQQQQGQAQAQPPQQGTPPPNPKQ